MEEDGWRTSHHLPVNWIYKVFKYLHARKSYFESQVIITTSKNYSVNINILSDLAEKFESYLATIKHLESNPR